MELSNMLIWYNVDDDGVPCRIANITAIPEDYDIDAFFEAWRKGKPGIQAENSYTYKKAYIVVPEWLQQVEGWGYHFYWGKDQLLRAVLPYFVTIKGDIDVELEE